MTLHTGFTIIELLLTHEDFKNAVDSVTALSLQPHGDMCKFAVFECYKSQLVYTAVGVFYTYNVQYT
jgi:hypothetical protein